MIRIRLELPNSVCFSAVFWHVGLERLLQKADRNLGIVIECIDSAFESPFLIEYFLNAFRFVYNCRLIVDRIGTVQRSGLETIERVVIDICSLDLG